MGLVAVVRSGPAALHSVTAARSAWLLWFPHVVAAQCHHALEVDRGGCGKRDGGCAISSNMVLTQYYEAWLAKAELSSGSSHADVCT